jgi:diguanylate cyclase
VSWLVADHFVTDRAQSVVRRETAALDVLADNLATNVGRSLAHLQGIPALIASDASVVRALSRIGNDGSTKLGTPAQRQAQWSRDAELRRIDRVLDVAASKLGADAVYVTTVSGDCVAASNVDRPESFVGFNYADRQYVRMAIAGQRGHQYALGRRSQIPGLYFSVPVLDAGRIVGVAVAKINLAGLTHWVNQTDAFMSDDNGVIFLAHDARLQMRAMPGAAIAGRPPAERMARYRQASFLPLEIDLYWARRFPSVLRLDRDGDPLLLATRALRDDGIDVHVIRNLPEIADLQRRRLDTFALLAMAGLLLLLAAGSRIAYARGRKQAALRKAKSLSLLRAAIESTADGILVVDNDGRITVHNRRFADMWSIAPSRLEQSRDKDVTDLIVGQLDNP